MTWQLVWTRPALRDMKKLGEERAGRVRQAMIRLIETGHGDIAKLRDTEPPEWRLRVGDQRVFFRYDPSTRQVAVLRVRPRDKAY